jgi:phage baseplate assembly protein W
MSRLKTDLRLEFDQFGEPLVGLRAPVEDLDNLRQALILRLLVQRGELLRLGHERYGSKVYELIGEPLTSANLELLRRIIQKTLREDPRVREVVRVAVRPRVESPGAVDIEVVITAITDAEVPLHLTVDLS